MASLKFIMDANDDQHLPSLTQPPHNKRDRPADNSASAGRVHEPSANPHPDPRHTMSPGLAPEKDINQAAPAQTERRGASSRGSSSAAPTPATETVAAAVVAGPVSRPGTGEPAAGTGIGAAIATSFSSSSPSLPLSPSTANTRQSATRGQSTTGTNSMDRAPYGSGTTVPSASMSAGPQRPMHLHPSIAHLPPKFTPKTGRVSKAQKGLPVHVCKICKPPKVRQRIVGPSRPVAALLLLRSPWLTTINRPSPERSI